jgi:four helix bundle protein
MHETFDHERLRAYQVAVRFCGWVTPQLETIPARYAARDQLDRASTSIVLNLAEGNGKRSYPDRCRYFDIARGSALECAACLDVLVVRSLLREPLAADGKKQLLEIVAMIAGLISRFSKKGRVEEDPGAYGETEDKE